MKETVFAEVNGKSITGEDILSLRKRNQNDEQNENFAYVPNEENNSYLNAEALSQLIDRAALTALAKFEGIDISEEEVSEAIFNLRNEYEDEAEWESALDDLGLNERNIRKSFYQDMMIEGLLQSHLEHFEEPDNAKAEEFYKQNLEYMKLPSKYTFLEAEIKDPAQLKSTAELLSNSDPAYILSEAAKRGVVAVLNEDISSNQLPEALQEVFKELPEQKIGTVPLEDDTIVLVKLLKKTPEKTLSLKEALPGLIEYLNYQQQKDLLDELTAQAVDKCDISYLNADKLKDLK